MRKVLVIDDSEFNLEVQSEVLRAGGFEVRGATRVADFDQVLAGWRPDIVLTDVNMPGMTGGQLCRLLKSRVDTENIPVVLWSSMPERELSGLAQKCGADAYLVKDAGPARMVSALQELCEEILW